MIAILDNILVTHRPNGGEGLEKEHHQTHKLSNKHSLQNMKKNQFITVFSNRSLPRELQETQETSQEIQKKHKG